ncbi:MAG: nuclear transport factor 2 family protein [Gemmatimonadales bacterium]
MRAVMLTCLLVVACRAKNQEQTSSSSSAPSEAERVVQHGLDAWNKHDVEGALSVFSPDVKIYRFPDKEVVNPLDSVRARWRQRFAKDPNVHVTVSPRIVHKNFVIDHETATGLANGGTRTADWIYEVDGGRIVRAWLLPE